MTMLGRRANLLLACAAALTAALAASGCGQSDKLLQAGQANSLDSTLQQVRDQTLAGECSQALGALKTAQAQVAALPDSIDRQLEARIREGLRQLAQTVPTQCKEAAARSTPTRTTQTTTETSAPTTSETTTTPTTTTTTDAPTTTTQQTTGTQPNGGVSPDQGAATTQPTATGTTP